MENNNIEKKEDELVIGIDFGTRNSCVSVWRNNKSEIICDSYGNRVIPSLVSFYKNVKLIGASAENMKDINPKNTVYDVKRLLGRRYDDEIIQSTIDYFTYNISHDETEHKNVRIKLEKKDYSPEEIASYILKDIKRMAEEYLKQQVSKAVLTIPAYYNDAQRQATLDASRIAGLNVIRMIHEPTAAALAYGLGRKEWNGKTEGNVIIFDLGAGTLDVSLMNISNGVFRVLAVSGSTCLGGEDFDYRIINHVIIQFTKKHNLPKLKDISPISYRQLKLSCENAKKILSTNEKAVICVDDFYNKTQLYHVITREEFNVICNDMFIMCIKYVHNVIKDINMSIDDIDDVLLVGGSTRIPKIKEELLNYFSKSKYIKYLNCTVNPDEVVSIGASICGHTIVNKNDPFSNNVVLLDITPLSLGVEVLKKNMAKIIPRGTVIPVEQTKVFSTNTDNETSVSIKVFEGERIMTKDNFFLGEFNLSGFEKAPRGVPVIKITFDIDINGILQVTAIEKKTDTQNSMRITSTWGAKGRLSKDKIEELIKESQQSEALDVYNSKKVIMLYNITDMCHNIAINLKNKTYNLTKTERETIVKDINRIMKWHKKQDIEKSDFDDIKKYADHVSKTYGPLIIKTDESKLNYKEVDSKSGTLIHGDDTDELINKETIVINEPDDYNKNEMNKMKETVETLCNEIKNIINSPITRIKEDDIEYLKNYIDTVEIWLYTAKYYSVMEYAGKLKEINQITEEIMTKYESNLFATNENFTSKDELLILCNTLLNSIKQGFLSIKDDQIDNLKKILEETLIWLGSEHELTEYTEKIFYINEKCNEMYHTMNVFENVIIAEKEEDEEKEEEIVDDSILNNISEKNKIREDISELLKSLDDDYVPSDKKEEEEKVVIKIPISIKQQNVITNKQKTVNKTRPKVNVFEYKIRNKI